MYDPAIQTEATALESKDLSGSVFKTVTQLVGNKYNKIARRFQMPATEAHAAFGTIDLAVLREKLLASSVVEFTGIQAYVIGAIVQQKFDLLSLAPELMLIDRCVSNATSGYVKA